MSKKKLKIRPFKASITQGSLWKNVVEQITARKTVMTITPEGISIVQVNAGTIDPRVREVLIDIDLKATHFTTFSCPQVLVISFDTKEHQKILKSMKKKNKLEMHLKNTEKGYYIFWIKIYQTNSNSYEGFSMKCSDAKTGVIERPPEISGVYRRPVTLDSAEYGKLKNLSSILDVKKLRVTTQVYTNAIRFDAGEGDINPAKKMFNEIVKKVPSFKKGKDGWIYCKRCSKFVDDEETDGCCRCKCEVCGIRRWECECICPCGTGDYLADCDCLAEPFEIISKEYPASALYKLTKLSSLQVPLKFYEPKSPTQPLKIQFDAVYRSNVLGTITIYVHNYNEVQNRFRDVIHKDSGKKSSKKSTTKKSKTR